MSIQTDKAGFYGDFSALAELKKEARAQSPDALRKAAQQFESLFTSMMLKSMRDANFGDALTGSSDMDFYQNMYDQQLATQLSKGKGMGLADMLVEQLTRGQHPAATNAPTPAGEKAAPASGQINDQIKDPTKDQKKYQLNPANQIGSTSAVFGKPVDTTATVTSVSQARFVADLLPHATQAARKLGVTPDLLVAHAALETGWGKHVPRNAEGGSSFNYFGIKASDAWRGSHVVNATLEYQGGMAATQNAAFRAYSSPADTFSDYSRVLSQPRYAAVQGAGSDGQRFAHALQSGGYATDPNYADKLQRVLANIRELMSPTTTMALNTSKSSTPVG